jgi:hypothetical protein
MGEDVSRRSVLALLAAGGTGALAACRTSTNGEASALRVWFREHHKIELSDDEIGAIREYLARPVRSHRADTQPAMLFDPEVDLG